MTMPKKVHDLTIWKAQRARAPIEFLPFRALRVVVEAALALQMATALN